MTEIMTFSSLQADVQKWVQRDDSTFVDAIPSFIALAENRIVRELKVLGFRKSITATFSAGASSLAKPSRWRATISLNCGTRMTYSTQARSSSGGTRQLFLTSTPVIAAGQSITVSGASDTTYNGTFSAASVSGNVVTYANGSLTESLTQETGATLVTDRMDRNTVYLRSYEWCRQYWPNPELRGVPQFYADYNYENFLLVPTPAEEYPFELTYYERHIPLDDANTTNWLTEYAPDLLLYASLAETAPYLKNDERIQVWEGRYNRILQTEYSQDAIRLKDTSQKTGNGGIAA